MATVKYLWMLSAVVLLSLAPMSSNANSASSYYTALAADAEVRRNVVVVAFVSHGCKYCDQQMPALDYIYNKYNGPVQIELVERSEKPKIFSHFDISVTPTLILFNGKGELLARYDGLTDVQDLDHAIDGLLSN